MQEEFLWHIWKFRLFDNQQLQTTGGEEVQVLKVGEHNLDSGPDFFNARIKIGDTEWAGNVEIHTKASDWEAHKHHYDKAYDNVILHVVHTADKQLKRKNGEIIPTLELKKRVPQDVYRKYQSLGSNNGWIPCGKQISTVSSFTLNHWLDRLLIERLERKTQPIIESLQKNHNNWEETFYQHLASGFGLKVNAQAFEILARSMPLNVLLKHKDNPNSIEALLFGQAGLLDSDSKDEYEKQLLKEYQFFKNKFKLKPMDAHLWKFMRLHPPAFPTIRISQFANLIFKSGNLFSKVLEAQNIYSIRSLLHAEASEYWKTHFRFGKPSPERKKTLGDDTKDLIIINIIVPFLFVYAKQKGDQQLIDRALDFMQKTEAENNSIISNWEELGIQPENAGQTQALLQLKNEYCSKKRCLQCSVGAKLLRPESVV